MSVYIIYILYVNIYYIYIYILDTHHLAISPFLRCESHIAWNLEARSLLMNLFWVSSIQTVDSVPTYIVV